MDDAGVRTANVRQMVPLLNVTDMTASLRFYVDGLGCRMTNKWLDEGELRWCWLEIGDAAVMIQAMRKEGHDAWSPAGPVGEGVSLCLMCEDALAIWRNARARGLTPAQPFVGNGLWVVSLRDPDGYRLDFESPTDVAEETVYEED